MSFAGRAGKGGGAPELGVVSGGSSAGGSGGEVARRPGARESDEPSWTHGVLFGAGVAVGALLGAGLALLYAPQSGLQTRTAIRRRGRRLVTRGRDAWDELAEELRKTARRKSRGMRRKATRARWAAEDWRDDQGW